MPLLTIDWDARTFTPRDEQVENLPGVTYVRWRSSDEQEVPNESRLFVVAENQVPVFAGGALDLAGWTSLQLSGLHSLGLTAAANLERHTMRIASVRPEDGSDQGAAFRLARHWLIRALTVLDQSHRLQNLTQRQAFQAPDDGLVLLCDSAKMPTWLDALPGWQLVGDEQHLTYPADSMVLQT